MPLPSTPIPSQEAAPPTTSTASNSPAHCWGEQYGYDPWANLLSIKPIQPTYNGCSQESGFDNTSFIGTNNRFTSSSGYTYDSAGNTITGPVSASFNYDAENHLLSTAGVTYTYDGDGKRLTKSNGTIYWYGAGSDSQDESDFSLNPKFIYGYFNGQRMGRSDSTNLVTWYFADHLGTARVVSNLNGQDESDFYPFGGERPITSGVGNRYKFTGKERDSESGLDNFGARYDSSNMGRFMSPDPVGGHQEDPQTLNRYAYVRNNPLNLTDPTGLDFFLQCSDPKHEGCTQVQIDPNNSHKTWVQAGKDGTATIITSDSIRNGENKATVDQYGVQVNGNQGIYFENQASDASHSGDGSDHNSITLDGRKGGAFEDFSVTINGNCNGTCLSSGTWSYPGSLGDARDKLMERGAFNLPGEDFMAFIGRGEHRFSTQYRFGAMTCPLFWCENSPHISVPYSPLLNVPQGFHVDAHGDIKGHREDVNRQGVE